MRRWALLAVLWLAGCPRPTVAVLTSPAPDPRATEIEVRYYRVQGDTAQALRETMEQAGPVFDDGLTYDAITRWKWTWRASWALDDGRCVVEHLDVAYQATVDFPLWVPEAGSDPTLLQRWTTFTDALWTHEMNHARNGLRSAEQVRRELPLVTAPSCAEMQDAVQAEARRIVAEANAWDERYDEESGRGWNEGVRFP